jgi:CII-binding regulator of phage lambda lysogenization HflD
VVRVSLEARTALYSRLVEVLGDAPAATLMAYLPGSEPATKADIESLANGHGLRFAAVEGRLDRLEDRMDRLEDRMDRLEDRMDRLEGRMERLEERMTDLALNIHSELRAQTRMFILASLGSSATLAVAIVTAAAIL